MDAKLNILKKAIRNIFVIISTGTLLDREIDDGSAPMYFRVNHTAKVIFINSSEEVFFSCRCRHIKGESPCCPVHNPSLGFLCKRHSPDLVKIGKGRAFWCKFSSLKCQKFTSVGTTSP